MAYLSLLATRAFVAAVRSRRVLVERVQVRSRMPPPLLLFLLLLPSWCGFRVREEIKEIRKEKRK